MVAGPLVMVLVESLVKGFVDGIFVVFLLELNLIEIEFGFFEYFVF